MSPAFCGTSRGRAGRGGGEAGGAGSGRGADPGAMPRSLVGRYRKSPAWGSVNLKLCG